MSDQPAQLLGQKFCEALDLDFETTFRYQFVWHDSAHALPGFGTRAFGGRYLHVSPELHVTEITSREGTPLGLVLGRAIDADGTLLGERIRLGLSASAPDLASGVEAWVKWLGGRYAVLLDLPGDTPVRRAYHDPLGSFGLVYDPHNRRLATSLLLCLDRDIDPSPNYRLHDDVLADPQLAELLPDFDPDLPPGGFGFGETADRHIRRLLANRYVDLTDFAERRFWPMDEGFAPLSMPDAAEIVVHRLRQMMKPIVTDLSGYFAISGGRDSRMLLAACPDMTGSDLKLYCYANNYITTLDLRVAEELAAQVGQPMLSQVPGDGFRGSFLPRRRRAIPLRHRFAVASGLMHMGDDWWQRGFARKLDAGGVWVRGNFLEIATARWWPRRPGTRDEDMAFALERIRIGLGDAADRARKMEQLRAWANSFSYDHDRHFHDFTYMDLTTAPPQANFHGYNHMFYLPPGSDRLIFRTSMQVHWKSRQRTRFYDEIMRQLDPDMHAIPLARPAAYQSRGTGIGAAEFLEQKISDYHAAKTA
ncbi:hypothetical protein [Thiosulfatihalobacter marinus]|uniref:hypothetical protein n=1 Tax=Thiosulfatihalobacter marinus TaxID=2792481 RepID=UPI0018DA01F4|nr:hypothetical protein [Thiosulfatihalobacter marinus]